MKWQDKAKELKSNASNYQVFDGEMSFYHQDKIADLNIACTVTVGEQWIEVKYDQDNGDFWSWKGEPNGEGHYILNANHKGGRSTLHRIEGSKYLEGYWAEGGFKGMWRIEMIKLLD